MTGEEMLRELETKAWARGWEECARRVVLLAFEMQFGPMPSTLQAALGEVHDAGELDRIMDACLSGSRDEIARLLGAGVH